jgi:hypothetical protein
MKVAFFFTRKLVQQNARGPSRKIMLVIQMNGTLITNDFAFKKKKSVIEVVKVNVANGAYVPMSEVSVAMPIVEDTPQNTNGGDSQYDSDNAVPHFLCYQHCRRRKIECMPNTDVLKLNSVFNPYVRNVHIASSLSADAPESFPKAAIRCLRKQSFIFKHRALVG